MALEATLVKTAEEYAEEWFYLADNNYSSRAELVAMFKAYGAQFKEKPDDQPTSNMG